MTKRVTAIALVLFALLALLLWVGEKASAQEILPPKGENESYIMVPPGKCTGVIELGTWKKELSELQGEDVFWARSPRKFVEPCEIFVEQTWVARYRLAARCVSRENHNEFSDWIRSQSGLNKPWPGGTGGCPGFAPGQPINPELCPVD